MAFDPLIKTCTVSIGKGWGADNVHPTAAGSMALGQYEASAIRSILAAL